MRGTIWTWVFQGAVLALVGFQLADVSRALSATSATALTAIVTVVTAVVTALPLLLVDADRRTWGTLALRGLPVPVVVTALTFLAVATRHGPGPAAVAAAPWLVGGVLGVLVSRALPVTAVVPSVRGLG